jgi:ABC-2 type transport system ATP-binding protein
MAVIRLSGVEKSYGEVRALRGLTVEAPAGAVGLLGPNGAGKTTLLRILLGLLEPDSGNAEVLGLDPRTRAREVRARIGYMPETDCAIPRLKGVRLVAFVGELSGLPRKSALTRAHEVLHYVGLGEARYRKVDEYSQGMRQRLRLAQALVHDPELLLLDEPTSGMDPAGRREMLDLILDLSGPRGKHVLLSSHLLPDVEETCGHVLLLDEGGLVDSRPLEEIRRTEDARFEARIAGDRDAVLEALAAEGLDAEPVASHRLALRLPGGTRPLFTAARSAGAQVRELRRTTLTLEEAIVAALDRPRPGEDG